MKKTITKIHFEKYLLSKVSIIVISLILLSSFASALQIGNGRGGNCNNIFCDLSDDIIYWQNMLNLPQPISDLINGILNITTLTVSESIDANQIYSNVIWSDSNRNYGTMFCVDGNIVVGYLEGYSC